ncbi:hypothetical protein KAW43_03070 [Candidatus Parcubacteria bacterium]|nr:hypothetical protein [Candidatus Parcubacteria bacterium]
MAKNRENIGKDYVESLQEQEKERDEMMEGAQQKDLEEKEAEKAKEESYKETYKETLDDAEKIETKKADEEMKQAQKEQMKKDYLEEYGFGEKPEKEGEEDEVETAKAEAEEEDAGEKEEAEEDLSKAQEKIKKEQLEKKLAEELDEPLNKLVQVQKKIKECEEHIKNPEAMIFKGAEIRKYEQEKEALMPDEGIIKKEIEELAGTYEGEGFLSEEEVEDIVEEKLVEKRGESGETIEEGASEEEIAEAEKTAEKREKLLKELEEMEQEVDTETGELPESKKEAFKKLLKNPLFYKVVIGGALVGASVVCPAFGVGYGAIGIMSAKTAGITWSIAGASIAAATGFKLANLLKKWRNKK